MKSSIKVKGKLRNYMYLPMAMTLLLVDSSATLSMLLAPPMKAPTTTMMAISVTAVR